MSAALNFPVVNGVNTATYVFPTAADGYQANFNAIQATSNPRLAYQYFLGLAPNGGRNRLHLSAAIAPPPASAAGLEPLYQEVQNGAFATKNDAAELKAVPGFKSV
jgi:hypothetical protein